MPTRLKWTPRGPVTGSELEDSVLAILRVRFEATLGALEQECLQGRGGYLVFGVRGRCLVDPVVTGFVSV